MQSLLGSPDKSLVSQPSKHPQYDLTELVTIRGLLVDDSEVSADHSPVCHTMMHQLESLHNRNRYDSEEIGE